MSHIHEKIDFTVTAFIVKDNKVLLRFHDKYKLWLGVGGHIELDEDPVEALFREVKEESGLKIEILSEGRKEFPDGTNDLFLPAFINRHSTGNGHEHIDFIYVARALTEDINPSSEEESEGVEFKWLTAEDLSNPANNLKPRTAYHANQALIIVQKYD
jgi:8-oxo-dGTP pyrophosphatase MutT (NUDIX family)